MQVTNKKKRHTAYIDGYLDVGFVTNEYNSAKTVIGREFSVKLSLAFNYAHIRDRDATVADGSTQEIDLKVECPFNLSFKNDTRNQIRIRDEVFDIVRHDISISRDKIYFFLKKVRLEHEGNQ